MTSDAATTMSTGARIDADDDRVVMRSQWLPAVVSLACLLSVGMGVCIGHGLWGPGGLLR